MFQEPLYTPPMVGAIGLGKQVKPFESLQAIVQGKPLAETKKELEPNKPAKKAKGLLSLKK